MKEMKEGTRTCTHTGEHNSRFHTVGRLPRVHFHGIQFTKAKPITLLWSTLFQNKKRRAGKRFSLFSFQTIAGLASLEQRIERLLSQVWKTTANTQVLREQELLHCGSERPPRDPEIPPTTEASSRFTESAQYRSFSYLIRYWFQLLWTLSSHLHLPSSLSFLWCVHSSFIFRLSSLMLKSFLSIHFPWVVLSGVPWSSK